MYGPNQFDSWKMIKKDNEAPLLDDRQIRMAVAALEIHAAQPVKTAFIFAILAGLIPQRVTPQAVPVRVR